MANQKNLRHLAAWRAFEAAARSSSFSVAASELCVSPAAVSQQIKNLESYLGVPLFIRNGRGVTLTENAMAISRDLSAAFDALSNAIDAVQRKQGVEALSVSVPPSFAVKWLIPRLSEFVDAHPGVQIAIDASERHVDLHAEGFDIAIRYGSGSYAGVRSTPLFREFVTPVASPSFVRAMPTPMTSHVWAKTDLVHDATSRYCSNFPTWRTWLDTEFPSSPVNPDRGLRVNSTVLAIEAAIAGRGALLGRGLIIADDISAGRLVKIATSRELPALTYFLIQRTDIPTSETADRFCQWLQEGISRTGALLNQQMPSELPC